MAPVTASGGNVSLRAFSTCHGNQPGCDGAGASPAMRPNMRKSWKTPLNQAFWRSVPSYRNPAFFQNPVRCRVSRQGPGLDAIEGELLEAASADGRHRFRHQPFSPG